MGTVSIVSECLVFPLLPRSLFFADSLSCLGLLALPEITSHSLLELPLVLFFILSDLIKITTVFLSLVLNFNGLLLLVLTLNGFIQIVFFLVICRQKVAATDTRRQEDKCYSCQGGQRVKLKEQLNARSRDLIEEEYKRS